jgi:non-specific serine/threonine protein kinase/NIMA (never in mitosis gene a)-related kinase
MDVYEVIKTIGSGSFGQVYMVRHKRECKNYVIKKVKTRDMNPKDLENTENEVTIAFQSLTSIINIGASPLENSSH